MTNITGSSSFKKITFRLIQNDSKISATKEGNKIIKKQKLLYYKNININKYKVTMETQL